MLEIAKKSFLKTLAYRDIFSYPVTYYQAYNYLISPARLSFATYKEAVVTMLRNKEVHFADNFFHLGTMAENARAPREVASSIHLENTKRVCRVLERIPWVKLVLVTGAVAAGNAPYDDDIDLLIITSKNRLWVTRFLVTLILKLLGSYRSDKNESGKICPNIYMSEDNMIWLQGRSVYTAHEVFLAKPILDRGEYYFKFLTANKWARKYLPHVSFEEVETPVSSSEGSRLMAFLENFLMKLQLWYMKNKKTNEVTKDNLIHFRRDDNSPWILDSFQERLRKLKLE